MKVVKNIGFSGDIEKLRAMVQLVPDERRVVAESLVDELAFMSETLADLKKAVKERGVVDHFKNGKQDFFRESPALKAYNTTIQRYGAMYKQIVDMLPKLAQDNTDSALYEFVKNG